VKELAETALLSSDVQQQLERQLLQMEHRTYLWLHLAIDDIRTTFQNSFWPAEEQIRLIPPSVNAAYEKILSRVPFKQVKTVRKILQMIVAARRPLSTQEMAIGLDLAFHPQSLPAKEKLDPTDLGIKLRRLCGLFVFIKNSRIYLIHQTAREFLISKRNGRPESTKWQQSVNLQEANLAFSQVCMTCLQHCENQENYCPLFEEGEAGIKCEGLLNYSATHWVSHLRGGGNPTVELLQLAGELCGLEKASMWSSYVEPPFLVYKVY
jgi:hypothetical protein